MLICTKKIELSGLDDHSIKVFETSAAHDLECIGFVDAACGYDLPAMSVTTFVVRYK